MTQKQRVSVALGLASFGVALAMTEALAPRAAACGGLFCSSSAPVNQAAEQILFSHNADGTVTAVIQILYEGPSEKFAWVLPVPGSPKVAVSSDAALDMLKQATNPVYMLQRVNVDCGDDDGILGFASSSDSAGANRSASPQGPVNVIAASTVGPYDYRVISVDAEADNPAQAALDWLSENGYDVGALGPDVLRPYLEDGLNLLAFKLTKDNDSGSIRPAMITYEGSRASIPIRPTAVAANPDMGVLVWVLADARAVPANYKALVLNDALINWFNPMSNYNEVVSRAADEAGGQGFVTEFAGRHQTLQVTIFSGNDRAAWLAVKNNPAPPMSSIVEAVNRWRNWQGFDEALAVALTGTTIEQFKACPHCFQNDPSVELDAELFVAKLEELVIKPMADTQGLLDSHPYLTRLYTTLSPAEMTVDPSFDINRDLGDLSNQHTAVQTIGCDGGYRVELPGVGTIFGQASGQWPIEMSDGPAARTIMEIGTSGSGRVVEDRSDEVTQKLRAHNRKVPGSHGFEEGGCAVVHGRTGSERVLALWAAAIVVLSLRRVRRARSPI